MKRFFSILLIFAIIIIALPASTKAADEVLVATNDLILPFTDAMPIYSGGVWYIDYQCFTRGNLKVNSAYNPDAKTLVLYTWDTTLIFKMQNATAYTTTEMIAHKQWSFASKGTVYIPAQFTAKKLGFQYSYLDEVPIIRLKSSTNISDNMFIYIAQTSRQNFIDAYNYSKTQKGSTNTQTKPSSSGSAPAQSSDGSSYSSQTNDTQASKPENRKIAYLTFNISSGKNNGKILNTLSQYGMKATFFLQGSGLAANDDSIRRMAATGNTIGISGFSGDSDFKTDSKAMLDGLNQTNDLLYQIAKVKSRLLRVPSGSQSGLTSDHLDALAQAGYRLWDFNINSRGTYSNPSVTRIYNTTVKALKNRTSPAIILLNDDSRSVSALPKILKYLKDSNYIIRTISVLDTPVNQLHNIK